MVVDHYEWEKNHVPYSSTIPTRKWNKAKEDLKRAKAAERKRQSRQRQNQAQPSAGDLAQGILSLQETTGVAISALATSQASFQEMVGDEIVRIKKGLYQVDKKAEEALQNSEGAKEEAGVAVQTSEKALELGSMSARKMSKIHRALERGGIELSDDSSSDRTKSPKSSPDSIQSEELPPVQGQGQDDGVYIENLEETNAVASPMVPGGTEANFKHTTFETIEEEKGDDDEDEEDDDEENDSRWASVRRLFGGK